MARRIFFFFFSVMLTFGLASYLMVSETRDQLEADRLEQQMRVYTGIREQLRSSYRLLEQVLQVKSLDYIALHQEALDWLVDHGPDADIFLLQQRLKNQAGFDVDVFIVSNDLIVTDTTFTPDRGLDFKHPAFIDAQNYLRLSKKQQRTLVSIPTLELASRQYKLYSYSPLPSGGYLELGLVDPQLQQYFQHFIDQSRAHPDIKIELFFEVWGSLLMRLGEAPHPEGISKAQLIDQQTAQMQIEQQRFAQITPDQEPQVSYPFGSAVYNMQIYDALLSLEPFPDIEMRLLGKVTFTDDEFASIARHVSNFFIIMVVLATLLLSGLMLLVRSHLVKPIQHLVAAISDARQIDRNLYSPIPELYFLATNYNQMLKKSQEQILALENLSIRDPLTGIYNRRHLETVLQDELARAQRSGTAVVFAMLDVDCFKSYNDLYGHQNGDKALQQLAALMHNHFRRGGDFVFRYGGEEFALLVTDAADQQIIERFESLIEVINQAQISHTGSNVENHITASIGVCLVDEAGPYDPESLIARADQALYRAKQQGRNRVEIFSSQVSLPDSKSTTNPDA